MVKIKQIRVRKALFRAEMSKEWNECMFGYSIHLPDATIRVYVKKKPKQIKGCGKMYCLVDGCGRADETHSAYCSKHHRSPHGICGDKNKTGTGYCRKCKLNKRNKR